MKKTSASAGGRREIRAKPALKERLTKTVLTFESRAQTYCWSTDRGRARTGIRH